MHCKGFINMTSISFTSVLLHPTCRAVANKSRGNIRPRKENLI